MSPGRQELLEELRPAAFSVAYRMLGSVAEAEDVVQESLLRVDHALTGGERIGSPRAYIVTIATRLAIDELRSARVRRERYVGEWLPEPLVVDDADDPARHAEMADSLSLAFLVLLESLSPEQRAVLLLRDVFDYGYEEIAQVVGKSEQNARQLAVRARRHVDARRPRFEASRQDRERLAGRFFAAAQDGDLAALEELLARDIVLLETGAATPRHSPAPCTARTGWPARCWRGHAAACERGRFTRSRSTGSPERCCTMPTGGWSASWHSTSPMDRSRA